MSATTMTKKPAAAAALANLLRQIVGTDHVTTDPERIAFFSQDVYSRADYPASVVVAPDNAQGLVSVMQVAAQYGAPVIARGGGMSYTGGYLPAAPDAVMIDTQRMNRILTIDEDNMFVTVETGCTWAALFEALKQRGLRTPFWGPLSGLASTIGGGLSQNNAFFGAGAYGPASDSVTTLRVVLADGTLIDTGSASTRDALPFFRHYGPDLTGLFLGDTGALGVKAEATFRLMRMPKAEGYASFAFATRETAAKAISAFSRDGIGCEVFGFDPNLQRVQMKRASLAQDLKSLGSVIKGQKGLLSGVKEAAKIAAAGRDFVSDDDYSVHIVCEGRSAAAVDADLAKARQIAERNDGREVENTIPKVVRANPFTPLNNMIGPQGERWAPVHGIVPHAKAPEVWREIDQYFQSMSDRFDKHGVTTGYLVTTISTNGFLIEPVFYWPEALDLIHEQTVEASTLSRITPFDKNEAATALVHEARARVAEIFLSYGAAHFQIGKTYLYRGGRKPGAWNLLDAVKSAVDPQRRINPGSLGLD